MHKSITVARVTRMVNQNMRDCDSYKGICKNCGKTQNGCEPDARDYRCNKCGECAVDGAEELLFSL